jgi:hypothetical protein
MIKMSNSMPIRKATGRYYELLDKLESSRKENKIDDFVNACKESLLYLDAIIPTFRKSEG